MTVNNKLPVNYKYYSNRRHDMDFGFDLVEAFKSYGILPTIGLGVLLVVLWAIKTQISNLFGYLISKIFSKKKSGDLHKHPAFHQMDNYISVKIPEMVFEDLGRNEVFKDMLTIMFESYIDMMKKILAECFDAKGNSIFTSTDDFVQKISYYGVQAIKEYEDQWRRSGVPLICITKFNEWHSGKRDALFTNIQYVANSPYHDSYEEKIAAFFDHIFIVLNYSILDAELILKGLNGELTGQTYKGIVIGHGEDVLIKPKGYTKKKSQVINYKEEN